MSLLRSSSHKLPQIDNGSRTQPKRPETHLGFTSNDDASRNEILDRKTAVGRLEYYEQLMAAGKAITDIDMRNLCVGGPLVAAIVELFSLQKDNVTSLNVCGNPLGTSCHRLCKGVKAAPNLRVLNFNKTDMKNEAVAQLAENLNSLPSLQTLSLGGNKLTDQGVETLVHALKGNASVTHLNLSKNKLWDSGAGAIANMMEANNTLQRLDLNCCVIGDKGAVFLALGLTQHQTITELNMYRNSITEEAVMGVADLLAKNMTLVKLGVSCGSATAIGKLNKLLKRNGDLQGENIPKVLENELSRLYVQKHKLQTSRKHLKDHQQQTLQYNDLYTKVESEFAVEKEEVQKQAKHVTEYIIYETTSTRDLQQKAIDMKEQATKDQLTSEKESHAFQARLETDIQLRMDREKEAMELQREYDTLMQKDQMRKDDYAKKMADVKTETQQHLREKQQCTEKIKQIQTLMAELKQKFNLESEGGSSSPAATDNKQAANLGDFLGQAAAAPPTKAQEGDADPQETGKTPSTTSSGASRLEPGKKEKKKKKKKPAPPVSAEAAEAESLL